MNHDIVDRETRAVIQNKGVIVPYIGDNIMNGAMGIFFYSV